MSESLVSWRRWALDFNGNPLERESDVYIRQSVGPGLTQAETHARVRARARDITGFFFRQSLDIKSHGIPCSHPSHRHVRLTDRRAHSGNQAISGPRSLVSAFNSTAPVTYQFGGVGEHHARDTTSGIVIRRAGRAGRLGRALVSWCISIYSSSSSDQTSYA